MCSNGDPKGLKGKTRLEYFDVDEANEAYDELLDFGDMEDEEFY
jgi:hypothetical protein